MPRARLPDFVVIGAQKAGTTSLHRMLRQHPQIHMPRTKELHYFDFNYERGAEWYAAQFSPGRRERRLGRGDARTTCTGPWLGSG